MRSRNAARMRARKANGLIKPKATPTLALFLLQSEAPLRTRTTSVTCFVTCQFVCFVCFDFQIATNPNREGDRCLH